MASAARDRLGKTLRGDAEPASSMELTGRMDALTLDVEGFGRVKFPVTPAKARTLITLGKPARFGRGEDTLTDPAVRDTWEIPAGLVRATWDPVVLRDVLGTVREGLGLRGAAELDVDLHSLLVYEPGQFFLRHQDTEKTDEMIGTLVVTLPSAYAGGELMIGRGEDWKAYRGSRDALSLVAFYADCQHEVLKLRSGYRITLTYNLMLRGDTSPRQEGDAGTVAELASLLREHFGTPATHSWGHHRADPPSRLVYLLDHEYTPRALKWTRMKGADARRTALLREAAGAADCEAILGLADVRTTHDAWPADEGYGYRRRRYYDQHEDSGDSAEYEINDLINTEVSLTHWTGPDGGRLEETSLSVDGTEACASTPSGDLEPYESEYEGYMGNWGNTLDRWYHRGAVIVWPRAQAFANRAETSPGWALDELVSIASSGDTVGAREAAATLGPAWSGLGRGNAVPPLGKALRAADAVADSQVAAMLLKPFRIVHLTEHDSEALGQVTAHYGPDWARELLHGWFGEDWPAWDRGAGQAEWVARSLPGICAGLHASGHGEVARLLIDLAWEQIRRDTDTGLASSSPSYRDRKLDELGKPLTALLATAAATAAVSTLGTISRYIRHLEGDPVAILEIAVLRAAAGLRAQASPSTSPSPGQAEFRDLAADCAARLRGQLARPQRAPGDWSVTLPAGGCTCDLCATLRGFLAAPDQRTLEWPLAKQRRQHVHTRIDTAEIPVTHVTKRQGSPYILVLRKTDDLFAGEQESRAQADSDLTWLAREWGIAI
ncbi:MAG TPA: 2OG-Fe(II) oxygenase [Trebonia sp.]|nr:2OG-Fe(II) oxygenase [Trebonia sp.]